MTDDATPAGQPFRPGLYVERGEALRLLASRCIACGALAFPRRAVCTACGSDAAEAVEIATEGRVYASTVVRVPSALGIASPYGCGYVDLDAGIRVYAWFGPAGDAPIPPGTRVRARTMTLRDDLQAYAFLPVGEDR